MTYGLLLSGSGCVDKFVHSSNCVNELNIIKLTTCHEFLLAQLCRFFKKEKKNWANKCSSRLLESRYNLWNHDIISGKEVEMRVSGIGFVKNILL